MRAPATASTTLILVALFCLIATAYGETWNVPSDALTIQAGIDSASAGDTVLVAPDTYYENLTMKAGIYVTAASGDPESTIVDADSIGAPISFLNLADTTYLEGFTLTKGLTNYGGGIVCINSAPQITNCRIIDNHANQQGGGALCEGAAPVFTNCVFAGNTSGYEGGAVASYAFSNMAFINCTMYGNGATRGAALVVWQSSASLQNSIIAFGTGGEPVFCVLSSPSFSCCDVYGNAGGDWVGCIAGQIGTNGNISEDPLFCDGPGGDFKLAISSPCFTSPCGIIGAFGSGCYFEPPRITSISDVSNDQGRWLRLTWLRSDYDAPGRPVKVLGYAVYRKQDEFLAAGERVEQGIANGITFLDAPLMTGWDCVGYVPARGDSAYQLVSPTLCDSTDTGICWSVFMVSAATDDPTVYFDSDPDSGYSVDNLAPSPPPGLMMTSPTEIAWDEVPDPDFNYYSVYGSAAQELDETATLIGYTVGTSHDVSGHMYDYYQVTATDFSGNEGEESSVENTYAGIHDLPDGSEVPTTFALRQNRPNPFSTTTVVAFDIPEQTSAQITIYDTHGRIIKRLANRNYEAGRHSVVWLGDDETGSRVGAGVYFIRMQAGDFDDMKKIMLLR